MRKNLLKPVLALLLVFALVCLGACSQKNGKNQSTEEEQKTDAPTEKETAAPEKKAPEVKKAENIDIPKFSVTLNGITVTESDMADSEVYLVEVTTTNSTGTVSTTTYAGYKMKDVLAAAGLNEKYIWLEATADDGYTVEYKGDITADTTLLALIKNDAAFKKAPWFAPCASETTGDYLKNCVSILVNTKEEAPEIKTPEKTEAEETGEEKTEASSEKETQAGAELEFRAPDKQDKTEKVKFGDFSFKVNGKEVKNQDLEGLRIYKISVVVENSKGKRSEATYSGYLLRDVLAALGIADPAAVKAIASDGYESELTKEQFASEYTLIAIEKDKETGEGGSVWVAPCEEQKSGAYVKGAVEIVTGE